MLKKLLTSAYKRKKGNIKIDDLTRGIVENLTGPSYAIEQGKRCMSDLTGVAVLLLSSSMEKEIV